MAKRVTIEEIYKKVRDDYDIESLLLPYQEGGTKEIPIRRSSGTILDWLINKKKFAPDIAGAGLISVLMELRNGLSFQGDGTYGSKGRELIHYVADRCDEFNRRDLQVEMFKTIAGAKLEIMDEAIFEMVRVQIPGFLRVISPGSWRWLRKRRQGKNNEPA